MVLLASELLTPEEVLEDLYFANYPQTEDSPSTGQTAIVPEGTDIANSGIYVGCHLYCAPLL